MSTNRYDISAQAYTNVRSSAKLLYVSSAKYNGSWHSTPHTHSCSELFYVTSGMGQFLIDGQIYTISANDLIIVPPHVEHTEISLDSKPLEYIVLGVEGLELSITNDTAHLIINFRAAKDTILFYL